MASILRSRPTNKPDPPSSSSITPSETQLDNADPIPTRLSLIDVLRVLGGLLLLSTTLSYFITSNSLTWGYRPSFTRPARVLAYLV